MHHPSPHIEVSEVKCLALPCTRKPLSSQRITNVQIFFRPLPMHLSREGNISWWKKQIVCYPSMCRSSYGLLQSCMQLLLLFVALPHCHRRRDCERLMVRSSLLVHHAWQKASNQLYRQGRYKEIRYLSLSINTQSEFSRAKSHRKISGGWLPPSTLKDLALFTHIRRLANWTSHGKWKRDDDRNQWRSRT